MNELILYRMPDNVFPTQVRGVIYVLTLNGILLAQHETYVLNYDTSDPSPPDAMLELATRLEQALGIRRVIRDVRPRASQRAVKTNAIPNLYVVKS
jgi:hypothetical protein